jgi:4-aminobutyrate aminotransferase-like enzyme
MIINVGGSYGNVVKLAPPLVITENQIDELTDKLVESMKVAVRK